MYGFDNNPTKTFYVSEEEYDILTSQQERLSENLQKYGFSGIEVLPDDWRERDWGAMTEEPPTITTPPTTPPSASDYSHVNQRDRIIEIFGVDPGPGGWSSIYSSLPQEEYEYCQPVTIPIWILEGNNKIASTKVLWVHEKLVSNVQQIFQEIFDDPEKFPFNQDTGVLQIKVKPFCGTERKNFCEYGK